MAFDETTTTRRVFLRIAATAAVAPAVFACSGGSGSSPQSFGGISAGNVSSLPVGSLRAIDGAPACIGRDAQGVYAMTLTCTHQGCDMSTDGSVSSSGISCSCHGSQFDVNGNVTRGPASSPLVHFAVTVDGSGALTVHGDQEVAASTRLAVG